MNVLFRVDASLQIGIGHLVRCFALAQTLKDSGHRVQFLGKSLNASLSKPFSDEKIEFRNFQNSSGAIQDGQNTLEQAREFRADWIVFDGYQFGLDYQKELRAQGRFKILGIDDLAKDFFDSDLLLNQNVYAEEKMYREKVASGTKLLLGSSYALLRREFRQANHRSRNNGSVKRVLITMGGADPLNQTGKALEALNKLKEDFAIDVVVGPNNPHAEALEGLAGSHAKQVELHRDTMNLRALMFQADLAITAAGSTCWELCSIGLPSILLVLSDNQRGVAESLGQSGTAKNLGWHENVDANMIAESAAQLINDQNLRKQMSQRASRLVDGQGAVRVQSEMERLIK